MLFHHVASSSGWSLLFHSHEEARALWGYLARSTSGLVALCLMPDHIHLLARRDATVEVRRALNHYTQWRNARRGERVVVFGPVPPVEPVKEGKKAWRTERYVHLNPCRARLVSSPLAWPWCSHRDAVGLSLEPVREVASRPGRYHARTVNDTTVDGYPLPSKPSVDLADLDLALPALRDAVSSLTRTPLVEQEKRGGPRTLFLASARALTPASYERIARFAGVNRSTVCRASVDIHHLELVERVVGDERFQPLGRLDSWALERWLDEKRRFRSRFNATF